MPKILGLPAILIILLTSMILERLTRSWMSRAAIKRGTTPQLADLQAAVFATWMFLPLTLIAFACCLVFAPAGNLDWPSHAPEAPEVLFKLVRDDHYFLSGLRPLLGIVLIYLAMQLMSFMGRIAQLTIARSTAARSGP